MSAVWAAQRNRVPSFDCLDDEPQ